MIYSCTVHWKKMNRKLEKRKTIVDWMKRGCPQQDEWERTKYITWCFRLCFSNTSHIYMYSTLVVYHLCSWVQLNHVEFDWRKGKKTRISKMCIYCTYSHTWRIFVQLFKKKKEMNDYATLLRVLTARGHYVIAKKRVHLKIMPSISPQGLDLRRPILLS